MTRAEAESSARKMFSNIGIELFLISICDCHLRFFANEESSGGKLQNHWSKRFRISGLVPGDLIATHLVLLLADEFNIQTGCFSCFCDAKQFPLRGNRLIQTTQVL
jgi:hypothetical protein